MIYLLKLMILNQHSNFFIHKKIQFNKLFKKINNLENQINFNEYYNNKISHLFE